jgi:hypothetical protein
MGRSLCQAVFVLKCRMLSARHDTDVGLVEPPPTGQPIGRSIEEGLRRGTADSDGASGQQTGNRHRHNKPGSALGKLAEISSR